MVVVVVLEENEVAADPDQDQAEHFQRTAAYVCTYERMHHTTILQAQGPLAESGRGAGILLLHHILVGGGAS